MGENVEDIYEDAKFTAEISSRMQVPDRIMVNNGPKESPDKFNDLGMRRRDPRLDMQVPDRILVAGGNAHIASKSTPRELQMENSVLPPTSEHVRVSTPPRSIRLEEHAFPSASDVESTTSSTPTFDAASSVASSSRLIHPHSNKHHHHSTGAGGEASNRSTSMALISDRENLSPLEEIQLLRRQMAKLNHRLMAVELENQQQQQREMIMTLLMSAYFIGKVVYWINRSL